MSNSGVKGDKVIIRRDIWISSILFLLAFVILLLTLGDLGLTWDEPFYIVASYKYMQWFSSPHPFSQESIGEYWRFNREHPPLGKVFMGINLVVFSSLLGIVGATRLASAFMFGGLVSLVYWIVAREWSWEGGLFASLSLLIMPRVLGHAHLATLDIPVTFMWLVATYAFYRGITSWRWSVITGVVFGLALTTKETALLLPLPLILWAHIYHRDKYSNNLFSMLTISPLCLFLTWPWLWYDTELRTLNFLAHQLVRSPVPVYYMGKVYTSPPPPWHYPLIMMAITLPPLVFLFSLLGIGEVMRKRRISSWGMLIFINALVLLGIIASPKTPKYDGVRLFLPLFPFLAILGGVGFDLVQKKISSRISFKNSRKILPCFLLLLFLLPSGIILARLHPYELSYYNIFIGGMKGAKGVGMETTYWGDTINPEIYNYLNKNAPPKARIVLYPVGDKALKAYQEWTGLLRKDLRLSNHIEGDFDYLVLVMRQGMFDEKCWEIIKARPVYSLSFGGVSLTNIYRKEDISPFLKK